MRLLILFLLISCGNEKKMREKSGGELWVELLDKRDTYAAKVTQYQDEHGFINSDKCDSVLFSGLLASAGIEVDLLAARDESGAWHRRPNKDCWPNGSGSSISRDMLAGVMFGLYFQGDIESLEEMRQYGRDNDWIMGQGSLDRTFFSPQMQDTLYRLTGHSYKGPPYPWVDPVKDHQRHIVALNIILRGEAQGKIDKPMLQLLEKFKGDDRGNALFQYGVNRFSNGDQTSVLEILSNENDFPLSGPVGKACSRWYWEQHQREKSGCSELDFNTGGDYLFIMNLLERSQKVIFRSDN